MAVSTWSDSDPDPLNSPSYLYELERPSFLASLRGSIGFNFVRSMDFHPHTGVLYAVGRRPSDGVQVLLTIDPATGAGSEVAVLEQETDSIAFRHTDRVLFGLFRSSNCLELAEIDEEGGITFSFPDFTTFPGAEALDISEDNVAYATGIEGSLTWRSAETGELLGGIQHSRCTVPALSVEPGTGALYGLTDADGSSCRLTNIPRLVTLDPASGNVTDVGPVFTGPGIGLLPGGRPGLVGGAERAGELVASGERRPRLRGRQPWHTAEGRDLRGREVRPGVQPRRRRRRSTGAARRQPGCQAAGHDCRVGQSGFGWTRPPDRAEVVGCFRRWWLLSRRHARLADPTAASSG
jgi:hypothetical protein